MGVARGQVPQSVIRSDFAQKMSLMYGKEVPLYKTLVDIVALINKEKLQDQPIADSIERITAERHGAIRLATYDELKIIARLFAVMGMFPVDYYDLSVRNLPVHSTAFRPIDMEELNKNPFRIFCSVLRMDLLDNKTLSLAKKYVETRQIFSKRLIQLIELYEQDGFNARQVAEFLDEAVTVFQWHDEAVVSKKDYEELLSVNGLIADIIGFKGPHINHLTPRVLDIDLLHERMKSLGHVMIPNIQGPPKRECDILLRQTSFQALNEATSFPEGDGTYKSGHHRARFGEIEQRGIALTPKGRELYDRLLNQVEAKKQNADSEQLYKEILQSVFEEFPDDIEQIRLQELGYFNYIIADSFNKSVANIEDADTLETLLQKGYIKAKPITYEDFLPVSAAGIFQSNLVEGSKALIEHAASSHQLEFEEGLGQKVMNSFHLYASEQQKSVRTLEQVLGITLLSRN